LEKISCQEKKEKKREKNLILYYIIQEKPQMFFYNLKIFPKQFGKDDNSFPKI
jgi:hypothetical protein